MGGGGVEGNSHNCERPSEMRGKEREKERKKERLKSTGREGVNRPLLTHYVALLLWSSDEWPPLGGGSWGLGTWCRVPRELLHTR